MEDCESSTSSGSEFKRLNLLGVKKCPCSEESLFEKVFSC